MNNPSMGRYMCSTKCADLGTNFLVQVIEVDVLVAKARFGRWMDACYPDFGAFPRNVSTSKQKKPPSDSGEAVDRPWIRLRRLRCPCQSYTYSIGTVNSNNCKGSFSTGIQFYASDTTSYYTVPEEIGLKFATLWSRNLAVRFNTRS